jgi:hypothetical protein
MSNTHGRDGAQCLLAIGLAEIKHRSRLDGVIGCDGLNDLVAVSDNMGENSDR